MLCWNCVSVSFLLNEFSSVYIPLMAGWIQFHKKWWERIWTYLNAREVNWFKIIATDIFCCLFFFCMYLSLLPVVFHLDTRQGLKNVRGSLCTAVSCCTTQKCGQSFYCPFAMWNYPCSYLSWIFHECLCTHKLLSVQSVHAPTWHLAHDAGINIISAFTLALCVKLGMPASAAAESPC